tara:strand:+ start:160 stop:618 length:459 start_codon:yes stop_codon:yes gene_type:complete
MRRYIVLLLTTGTIWSQPDFDKLVPVIDYENLSIKGKAFYDAKKESRKWILYPPTAFLMFGAIMLGSQEEPWESFPATLGISAASLTIPYRFFKELTWKNLENLSSRDKKLYEKVYSKELRKRKSTIIFTSSVVTGLLGPLLYVSAVVAGLS